MLIDSQLWYIRSVLDSKLNAGRKKYFFPGTETRENDLKLDWRC